MAVRYGFRSPPHLELKARPKLGEREVTLVHVTDWIEKKLDQEFQVHTDKNRKLHVQTFIHGYNLHYIVNIVRIGDVMANATLCDRFNVFSKTKRVHCQILG